ncbi:hypothetical protein GWI33_017165 [Rhynchophorus ferrugineus]|uniref:Uncharacterized protein n=1 Tax=Rhynchophorus ferrugineus TaxID=354439 RepID=A0A834HZ88_RHYFE|nr:hypothetical protein GWI33_017165 [Rhynchophorus ferrugineus]
MSIAAPKAVASPDGRPSRWRVACLLGDPGYLPVETRLGPKTSTSCLRCNTTDYLHGLRTNTIVSVVYKRAPGLELK